MLYHFRKCCYTCADTWLHTPISYLLCTLGGIQYTQCYLHWFLHLAFWFLCEVTLGLSYFVPTSVCHVTVNTAENQFSILLVCALLLQCPNSSLRPTVWLVCRLLSQSPMSLRWRLPKPKLMSSMLLAMPSCIPETSTHRKLRQWRSLQRMRLSFSWLTREEQWWWWTAVTTVPRYWQC